MSTVRKVPLRKCIGCNEMKNKKEMIRVLKTADDTIEIDATGRRNGRGAYLCPSMDCWKKAVKSKNERTRCLCLLSGMSGESNEKQRTFPFSEGRNSIRGL